MISKCVRYQTRSGLNVRIYATGGVGGEVHGAIETSGGWAVMGWDADGRYDPKRQPEHVWDLVEVTEGGCHEGCAGELDNADTRRCLEDEVRGEG